MMSSRLVLHASGRHATWPYLLDPPLAAGRALPNGSLVMPDPDNAGLFHKFTPWKSAFLAFNEVDTYSSLRDIGDPSGIVQLHGVSATQTHFVRSVERSRDGALNRFLFDATEGDCQRMQPGLACSLLAQIAGTLADMHALDIVHRDIKAENMLVFGDLTDPSHSGFPRVKVSDFDRAIHSPGGQRLENPVGSLFHMAPELLDRRHYDRKVDVYAFGILMYEVVHGGVRAYANVATGMPDSITAAEFSRKVVTEGFRPDWRDTDPLLRELAADCWNDDPAARPHFREIAERLRLRPGQGRHGASSRRGDSAGCDSGIGTGIGMASDIGKSRARMEDACCVLETGGMLVAGVFDGLRGSRVAEFACRRLPLALAAAFGGQVADPEAVIAEIFADTDEALLLMKPPVESGSTAVVAVLREGELWLAWLGDSPACLLREANGRAGFDCIELVDRHHPDRADEAARVTAAGGIVDRHKTWLDNGELAGFGPPRVFAGAGERGAGIALSRALGLFAFKPAIGSQPEMRRLSRHPDDCFLVLGSDGVFDLLVPEKLGAIVAASASAQQAADAIIEAVLDIGAPDNASVVVIDLGAIDGASR